MHLFVACWEIDTTNSALLSFSSHKFGLITSGQELMMLRRFNTQCTYHYDQYSSSQIPKVQLKGRQNKPTPQVRLIVSTENQKRKRVTSTPSPKMHTNRNIKSKQIDAIEKIQRNRCCNGSPVFNKCMPLVYNKEKKSLIFNKNNSVTMHAY